MASKFYDGEIYHIFNKSIASYAIFRTRPDSLRFLYCLDYYNNRIIHHNLAHALQRKTYRYENLLKIKESSIIDFLCFCIMPDHYHLLTKVVDETLVSKYINDLENSYTRYFNIKNHRKGPLWQTSFKAVRIKTNEQLLHVSRYIHLNPTSSSLVNKPEDWEFSSYLDYINGSFLEFNHDISIVSKNSYKSFVENNKDYQKTLKIIKRQIIE